MRSRSSGAHDIKAPAMSATAASLSAALSSLSLHCHRERLPSRVSSLRPLFQSSKPSFSLQSKPQNLTPPRASPSDTDTTYFDTADPDEVLTFSPPGRPEGFILPPSFDEVPIESEEDIDRAFEELYGPAYSGETFLGNDVYVMDSKVKKTTGLGSRTKKEKVRDGFDERVVQVRRVNKVVKGRKQLHFRAVVVVGDKQGNVGVGVGKAKEVVVAVQKSAVNARRNIIAVPMTNKSFPHRSEADHGAA